MREIAKEEAHVITPLSVVYNSHKLRLNLDLSFVNKFLSVPKFHNEDTRTQKDLFQKGDFFSSLILKVAATIWILTRLTRNFWHSAGK